MKFGLFFFLFVLSNVVLADSFRDYHRTNLMDAAKAGHHPLTDYGRSREYVFQDLDLRRDSRGYYVKDVYCEKMVRSSVGPHKKPNAREMNIEHTWPKSRFNKRQSYKYQVADLHHLFPTNSHANSIRSSNYFTEPDAPSSVDSNCRASHVGGIPGKRQEGFEPPDNHKGNVARALFYFAIRYQLHIPDYEEVFLRAWNEADPVDYQEIQRNNTIEKIQGNRNPFVDDPTLVDTIDNF